MSILDTHTSFIKYAQDRYRESVNAESPQKAQFWLEQMHLLCEQMYWLSQAAGPPVAIATMPQGLDYTSVMREISQTPGRIVDVPRPKPVPTEYQWNDGFEGVTLPEG